jgi:uncharacterized linocin/CFP29 family protein
MTDHLLRDLAPVSDDAWGEIEAEATRTLRHHLAARKLVDFTGPLGYAHSSVSEGRLDRLDPGPTDGTIALRRRVLPLLELQVEMRIPRVELDAVDRGADDPDLDAVTNAAKALAIAEDRIVFEGFSGGGIRGIAEVASNAALTISDDYSQYPSMVARAVSVLQDQGVGGPYAIALGPRCYTGVVETTELGGYPVLEHLRLITGGPVVWAPAVNGAIVLSQRGGDFELIVGEDVSIAYVDHDRDSVTLRLEETLAFRVLTPEAAVALRYP